MGVLTIYDIMFAHNVPGYMATKMTCAPQVATPGAKSAVYDCLVIVLLPSHRERECAENYKNDTINLLLNCNQHFGIFQP